MIVFLADGAIWSVKFTVLSHVSCGITGVAVYVIKSVSSPFAEVTSN
jgi:hypothetical protein